MIAQRRDHHVGPEAVAVFAQPPALFLIGPLARGCFQFAPRLAGAHILFRIEAGEMLADDFRRAVALHALGAVIPTGDPALRVEHEDGIVLHRIHEQPEVLLDVEAGFGTFGLEGVVLRIRSRRFLVYEQSSISTSWNPGRHGGWLGLV